METVFDRLSGLLKRNGLLFESLTHDPVFTSEEAARVRGTSLSSGAKALIVKADERVVMLVLPGDRRLDRKKVRAALACKSFRFLDRDELLSLTGLETGAVPPFGSLFDIPTYCDRSLGLNREINFNAGDRTASIKMAYEDYVRVEKPDPVDLSERPGS